MRPICTRCCFTMTHICTRCCCTMNDNCTRCCFTMTLTLRILLAGTAIVLFDSAPPVRVLSRATPPGRSRYQTSRFLATSEFLAESPTHTRATYHQPSRQDQLHGFQTPPCSSMPRSRYRGTRLRRNNPSVGTYAWGPVVVLGGGGVFLMGEVPLYPHIKMTTLQNGVIMSNHTEVPQHVRHKTYHQASRQNQIDGFQTSHLP